MQLRVESGFCEIPLTASRLEINELTFVNSHNCYHIDHDDIEKPEDFITDDSTSSVEPQQSDVTYVSTHKPRAYREFRIETDF